MELVPVHSHDEESWKHGFLTAIHLITESGPLGEAVHKSIADTLEAGYNGQADWYWIQTHYPTAKDDEVFDMMEEGDVAIVDQDRIRIVRDADFHLDDEGD